MRLAIDPVAKSRLDKLVTKAVAAREPKCVVRRIVFEPPPLLIATRKRPDQGAVGFDGKNSVADGRGCPAKLLVVAYSAGLRLLCASERQADSKQGRGKNGERRRLSPAVQIAVLKHE